MSAHCLACDAPAIREADASRKKQRGAHRPASCNATMSMQQIHLPFMASAVGAKEHSSAASTLTYAAIRLFVTILDGVCRIKEMIELVFETIREPMRIVNVPVAIGKLLAAPRERFFKSVRILRTHPQHSAL